MIQFLTSLAISLPMVASDCKELTLDTSWKVESQNRFDLSGFALAQPEMRNAFGLKGDLILISDKTSELYVVDLKSPQPEAKAWIDLRKHSNNKYFDLEAVDVWNGRVFVVNEPDGLVFEIAPPVRRGARTRVKEHAFPRQLTEENPSYSLAHNFGIEALSVTTEGIFWGKEMMPLAVFFVPWKKGARAEILKREALGSQTDMKLQNDFFYFLNREARAIHKVKRSDLSDVACVSIAKTVDSPEFRFPVFDGDGVEHLEWGTAEALELTPTEIFVGLDNNGQNLKAFPDKRPRILRFRRPSGF